MFRSLVFVQFVEFYFIMQGQINLDYDGPFIYAEVNATKKYWKEIGRTGTLE